MSSVHYKVKGEGQPLILIHGFCETSDIWDLLTEKLSKEIQVVTVDLPGFGRSELPNAEISLEAIGSELNDWVLSNNIKNPIIMGHSLGGYVCLAMLSQKPDLFAGLGLIHSTAKADSELKRDNRSKVMEFVKSNGVQAYVDSFIPGLYYDKNHPTVEFALEIARKTTESTFLAYTLAMRNRPSREHVLENLRIPALIIGGQNDPVIDLKSLEDQSKLSEMIRFFALNNVAHMGILEAEIETAAIVSTYVAEIGDRLKG